jgi:non-ribosomal peptide synthetase component F
MKRPWFLRELSARVQSYPDAIALDDQRTQLTYRQLWQESLRVGGRLASDGVGPEDLVGLHFPKSLEYVIALLGVWQCGAAFLPLDPQLPAARLREIQERAGCALVLSDLPGAGRPGSFPVYPGPDSLAYVIYTSGSTADFKGVEVTQGGLPGLFRAQIPAFAMNARARSLWLSSIQLDASISDLGCALLAGATLCLPVDLDVALEVKRCAITHLDVPPAFLRVYQPQEMAGVTSMIVDAKASEPAVVRSWAQGRRLVQVYGPTEATICSSLIRVDASWDAPRLGRAIWGMHHTVVDDELCISGPGLARGYRSQPELTAQRFVMMGGVRHYRTGHRVRWLGGDCEFLGSLNQDSRRNT